MDDDIKLWKESRDTFVACPGRRVVGHVPEELWHYGKGVCEVTEPLLSAYAWENRVEEERNQKETEYLPKRTPGGDVSHQQRRSS